MFKLIYSYCESTSGSPPLNKFKNIFTFENFIGTLELGHIEIVQHREDYEEDRTRWDCILYLESQEVVLRYRRMEFGFPADGWREHYNDIIVSLFGSRESISTIEEKLLSSAK
jgi:hypothetical protein